jgi:hypothetical protein
MSKKPGIAGKITSDGRAVYLSALCPHLSAQKPAADMAEDEYPETKRSV